MVGGSRGKSWLVAGIAVLGLGLGVGAVRRLLVPAVRFGSPSGPFGIGTLNHHWVDASRREVFSSKPSDRRELMVQIWYPADPRGCRGRALAPYVADADQVTNALARLFHVPSLTFSGVRRGVSNAVERAPVASAGGRFPVLVFLQGACGFRTASTFQVQELVSHGYVVVAPDQPYTAACVTFPDGRRVDMPPTEEVQPLTRQSYLPAPQPPVLNGVPLEHGVIPFLGRDVSFVLDRLEELSAGGAEHPLAGRLDLSRIGLAGLSLGGIVAAEAARADERVRATLIMDAPVPVRTVAAGLDRPTMWLTRPADTMRGERQRAGGWSEEEIEAHHATMRTTFDSLRAPGYFVQVPDISHLDFTDVPAWSPVPGWLGLTGPRDAAYAHEVINAYNRDFFDRHLRGLPGPLLDGPCARFPDVTIDLHEPIT